MDGLPPRASKARRQSVHGAASTGNRLRIAPAELPGNVSPTDIGSTVIDFNSKQQARLELTDEDHALLASLDPQARIPLVAFLRGQAPEIFGDNLKGAHVTADQAEDFLDQIIHGSSPQSEQRRRGLSRWGHLRHVSHFTHGAIIDGGAAAAALSGGRSRRDSQVGLGLDDGSPEHPGGADGGDHNNTSGKLPLTPAEIEAEKEAAFEAQLEAVAHGVQKISERHRERTLRLRLANRDVDDIASQVIGSRGARVVTTTGRPPPSHAVDAVGGIKEEMKVTHGEPPLMVLRQELEDRQALAAAMPRIRARVAEIMGKLQKQQAQRPNSMAGTPSSSMRGRSASRGGRRPASATSFRSSSPATFSSNDNTPAHQRHPNNSPPPPGTAGGVSSSSSPGRSKSEREIAEIARRLKLRSESLREQADKEHDAQVERRRAASTLRRELVSQGLWVDVRILSMFRPPSHVKVFCSSWQEFRAMVLAAVSPLPPGCSFSALSYMSGVGAKSIIDPRHPLLRPLRGFEGVRSCKTRDGTCASLTVSIAIRSSGEAGGAAPDGFVV